MLSLRTQDRMSLLPYKEMIEVFFNPSKEQISKAREKIGKFNQEIELKSISSYSIKCGSIVIATYKTKERALEVLDEIEEVILSANMWVGDGIAVDKVPPQNRIYQMPKE